MPLIRDTLKHDEVMERLAAHSTAEARPIAFVMAVGATAAALAIGLTAHGIAALVALSFAIANLVYCVIRFRRERSLLSGNAIAVATVSHWQRSDGPDGGYYYEVRYRFLAQDGKVYTGRSGASSRGLPSEGETIPILYRMDDPNQNLTMATFWFYRFTYTGTE